jgi:hypothetical protein
MTTLGPKTQALLDEHAAATREPAVIAPKLDQSYRAGDLPAGSVVKASLAEYVIGRSGLCMRWEQPIPGSDDWQVTYAGRLAVGVWLTHRERAEVDEAHS